jgi:radical SAM superfamily enzyme YgiQ (UPF0313 family)
MTVLLTHGYFLQDDPKEQKIMMPYVPLGILYISAYLEEKGIDNEVFDTTFSDFEALKAYILLHKPHYLAIYVNLMTKLNVLRIIEFVKNTPEISHIPIILGGPEVRNHAEKFLSFGADVLVMGEGEETTLAIIEKFNENKNPNLKENLFHQLADIEGIAILDEAKKVFFTKERNKIRNIDELPFPNRKKVNLQLYLDAWKNRHGKNAISVSTMRGCPYTCKWCSRAVYGMSYRRRSAKIVADELEYLQSTYQPDTLWFVDDVFTISHKWLREFHNELKTRNLSIPYECITRADRLNEEAIQLLKETGCFRVWIGAESGSQRVIDLMDRRVEVNVVREMIQLSQKKGIQAGTFIMLGYPQETEADILETVHHLKTSNPDIFTITVAYPIKGTELYQEIENEIVTDLKWEASTDRDIDFKRVYSRKYYDFAVRFVVNEVNFYKRMTQKQYFLPSTWRMKLAVLGARAGMFWYRNQK